MWKGGDCKLSAKDVSAWAELTKYNIKHGEQNLKNLNIDKINPAFKKKQKTKNK